MWIEVGTDRGRVVVAPEEKLERHDRVGVLTAKLLDPRQEPLHEASTESPDDYEGRKSGI
jgi:hypothetical protein